MQIFTDLATVRKGRHLCLPLKFFHIFKQPLPRGRRKSTESVSAAPAPLYPPPSWRVVRRRKPRGRNRVALFYNEVVEDQVKLSAVRAAMQAQELRSQVGDGAPIHVPMVVFDERGRPHHSFYAEDVRRTSM